MSSSGKFPDVLVDGAGTSHIVWVTSDGVNADAVHYCRLKRGARACNSSQTFVPQKSYADGDSPSFNNSNNGARIVQVGQQIVILDYRYPTDYAKPDHSTSSNTVLEWVSEDGGSSFTGPAVAGDQPISGGVVAFGPENSPKILTTTDGVTGGTYVQAITPGQFTSDSGNLADGGVNDAYSGSLALDHSRPVAAFSDLSSQTLVRRWTGAGSPTDASTWTPSSALRFPGSEPKLAGGPRGLFVMNRRGGNGPYVVRRLVGNRAGAPVPVSDGNDAQYRDFSETSSGGLVAAWESRGGNAPGVSVRTSPDAKGWSGTERLVGGADNGQIRVGAAGDGGGVAVLNHTGGVNSSGRIEVVAYGSRKPTGAPGIAGIPGGGDPSASAGCQQVGFGQAKLTGELGCFLHGTGSYTRYVVTDGELNLNGLRIVPDPGVQILIDPNTHTIKTTGKVTVRLENSGGLSITLWHGSLDVTIPTAGAGADLFNFDMSKFAADLEGFPIDAKIDVKLEHDGVRIPVDLKLPAVFGGITGHADLVADRTSGLHLDTLSVAIANAPIGPLLADFNILYTSADDQWEGHGALKFPPQPAGLVLKAGVIFRGGHFIHGDLDVKPFGYGIPVFTDVYIDDINGAVDLEPHTVITAGVGVGAIPLGPPTNFTNTLQVNGKIAVTIADPFRIEVTGDGSLIGVPVFTSRLLFVSDGFLSVDGQTDFSLAGILDFNGGINAVVDLPHRLFSAELHVSATLADLPLSQVDGIISSKGFALCGKYALLTGTVGHHFGHDYTDLLPKIGLLEKCDLSGYRVMASPSRAVAAAAGVGISVPRAKSVNIAVHGAGGAPAVTLTPPGGRARALPLTDARTALKAMSAPGGPAAVAFAVPHLKTTIVVLRGPAPGTWHVASQTGSPAITGLAESQSLAPAAVRAHVLGHGRRLRLSYTLHPRPGLSVKFAELAHRVVHVIGAARGARGMLSFHPGEGPAGLRRIVALIEQDGLPQARVDLARYRAPGPRRPGRVPRLKLSVRGRALTISFGAAGAARSYQIRISSTDGKHRLLLASNRHRSVRLRDIGPGARLNVGVRAVAADGRKGPTTRGRAALRVPRPKHKHSHR